MFVKNFAKENAGMILVEKARAHGERDGGKRSC